MLLGYDVSGRIAQAVVIGSPTFRELQAMMEAAFSDPRLSGPGRLLIDARRAQLALSEDELRDAAARLGSFRPRLNRRCAIVVCDEVGYAQASMLSAHAAWGDVDVRVFRDCGSAVAWLEGPEDADAGGPS
jgi:hypothetical protein